MVVETPAKIQCPPSEDLRKLIRGKLPDAKQEDITGHLDDCPGCQSKLDLLADGDTNLSGYVKHVDKAEPPKNSAYWNAIDAVGANLTSSFAFAAEDTKPKFGGSLDFLQPLHLPGKIGRLGEFQVIREIGRGGMGIVLQAFDPNLEREVAIKVLMPELAHNDTAKQRFCREARAAAAVTNENIVTVYSVNDDEFSGLPFFTMQLVVGETLEQRIRRQGKLSVDAVVAIAFQTAQGLAAAHAGGLIHRDIKPGNILLEAGTDKAKLTDFGLARAAEDLKLTRTGFVAGTPLYMAPEQARGDESDARADLFSLGSVMYEALAGKPPFDGATPLAVLRRVADEAHPRLGRINQDVPDWLEDVIDELLEKDPLRRIQTADDLVKALSSHTSVSGPCASNTPVDCTVARTASRIMGKRRKTALTTAMVLGLPFLLGGGVGALAAFSFIQSHEVLVEVPGPKVVVPAIGSIPSAASEPKPFMTMPAGAGAVWSIAVANDGKTFVAGLEDGSFSVWDLETGNKLITKDNAHDAPIWSVDISRDGKTVVTASDDATVKVWDVAGEVVLKQTFKHPTSVRCVALDANCDHILSGDRAGKVRVWKIGSDEPLRVFDHGGTINGVAFNPDGLYAVSVSSNKTAAVWDITRNAKRETFQEHKGPIYCVAFSPEGQWIATGSWDKSVMIWKAKDNSKVREIAAHEEGVISLAFSCCGRILASASQAGSVKVWDAENGKQLASFNDHTGSVHAVRFVPHEKGSERNLLLTGGRDGIVRAWEVKAVK